MANISKKQKELNKAKIIETAVDLITESGFKNTTMKQIAKTAGIGDATIYKYFGTKEDLLVGYYDYVAKIAVDEVKEIPDIKEYNIHESLYVLLDTYLKELTANREFVSISLSKIFRSPMLIFKDGDPVKAHFKPLITELLDNAIESGEIPTPPSKHVVSNIICELYFGIVLYWLKDDSKEYSKTTQLSEISIALISDILRAGIMNKGVELISFFMKAHFYSAIERGGGIIDKFSGVINVIRRQSER